MSIQRREFIVATGAAALGGWSTAAHAQTVDTLKVICGFPPGGTTDAVSRRVADKLRGTYAKNAIVENKPGAGGRLGVEELRRSPADGSTMLLTPAGMITLYPHIYRSLSYGPNDVTPVSIGGRIEFGFGVGPAVPDSVKDIKGFLEWAKANPANANYGSPGAGSPPHFLAALLAKDSGVDLRHVPYRGSAPGIQDLLGGQVSAFSSPVGDYLPHLKTGRLRLLATSGSARSRFTPDVATYAEQGFKDLVMGEWYGFFMPAGTPANVVSAAAQAIRQAVAQPDVIESFAQLGVEAASNTPAEMAAAVRNENAQWGPIVKKVGFTPEA
ncbi:Bug family tripartite tricarboxylate transporter substrate binding protein [Calidifontimicrobium sp. SYSU G02091]|uniref:Bug family tripartite tricarboxylate transporter substrate binding protein n=1 Tax=Calidifontimicrobium sp. SYSU G02091 TaxID=2926421 RepID=UPI001F53E1C3|nr:Bug family tripartite tricarboxylate transporter substrate binding protein [Calidifontimicrobium sp. SYSU G02091]MCI1190762.1 Bug family tripartite tricarboxylate transporter substrate binding protein [Calidifontimicrobium sp. SYSU G02091]